MLKIEDLHVSYGHVKALEGVSLDIPDNKIISIIGSNGAGKTTLLNTISGIVKADKGKIYFNNEELSNKSYEVVKRGIVQVPEGRKVFAGLTIKENLIAGGYLIKNRQQRNKRLNEMLELFPILKERENQQAGTMSGGEQQMLAIARGLMSYPKLVLLDEPSLGLSPFMVKNVFKLIKKVNEMGITIMLVEQNANQALALSSYGYVLENGKLTMQGNSKDLLNNPDIKKAYLGQKKKNKLYNLTINRRCFLFIINLIMYVRSILFLYKKNFYKLYY